MSQKKRRRTALQKQALIREVVTVRARIQKECGIEHPTFSMTQLADMTGYARTNASFRNAVWALVDSGYLTAIPQQFKSGVTDVRWGFCQTTDAPMQLEVLA